MSHQLLIEAAELRERLADPAIVVMDCRFNLRVPQQGFADYLGGHIPGARYVHLDRDLAAPVTPASGRHPLPSPGEFGACLGSWGVSESSLVVAYDDVGGAIAARLWWMLRWIGHDRVALLDGGLNAWRGNDYPLGTEIPTWDPTHYVPAVVHDDWTIETASLQAALDGGAVLLDARSRARFEGKTEPIDAIAGHIPGARNLPFGECIDEHTAFLPPQRLAARFEQALAGQSDAEVIAMCGSGVTACHLLLSMELAGHARGKLYVGSWSEWIRDSARPVATRAAD